MEPRHSAEDFYDDLAAEYHLIFRDRWKAAQAHGEIVDKILFYVGVSPGARLLDCTCGIGTQALPLSLRGYRVLGTDISAAAVHIARQEAKRRNIAAEFVVSDVRDLAGLVPDQFEAVLACDNSLAHLLTEEHLLAALLSIRSRLASGGAFLASIRDYDQLTQDRPTGVLPVTYSSDRGRRIVGQAWEWTEAGDGILVRLFILKETRDGWSSSVRTVKSRAWHRADLESALSAAGFRRVIWHSTDESGYHQPIVTARAT